MAFPDAPRVLYDIKLLGEVVCQLKFPPVLKVDAGPPAGFQERIKHDYPYYDLKTATVLPADLPPELAQMIRQGPGSGGALTHWFGSADRLWWVGLTRGSLALHCRAYSQWEAFRDRLAGPYQALLGEYTPAFFDHVCLRYPNAVRRSKLPQPDAPWSEWLQPWVCGPFGTGDIAADVESVQTRAGIRLPDGVGQVDATYGLADEQGRAEKVFVIDAHVYSNGRTEPSDVTQRLDALHHQARLFFRWCITDRLHHALGPRALPLGAT